ncbi:hypothetical protein Nepgr_021947 [Nepenthes gracilis]|uniref:Uncharacterized protein n=1 Tax=Nepenthes gracilis TaxID=150966 RepID=A0AAD3T1R0_NEPGR|nr:hypothetical protein Nepgr_021947 [Nepenthes gracilis]
MDAGRVQHISKASADQLLRKFAEVGSDSSDKASARRALQAAKRRKVYRKSVSRSSCDGTPNEPSNGGASTSLVERKSLLPQASRQSALLKQFGITRSHLRARDFKNRSIAITIEKAWRKAVGGASRVVFMKTHYNTHKRLIVDDAP